MAQMLSAVLKHEHNSSCTWKAFLLQSHTLYICIHTSVQIFCSFLALGSQIAQDIQNIVSRIIKYSSPPNKLIPSLLEPFFLLGGR